VTATALLLPRPSGARCCSSRYKDLTPLSKPSPYVQRWWTKDLTTLRKEWTKLRNRARATRRSGGYLEQTEDDAREASKRYHKAIRVQKKAHWEDFLAEDTNIWSAARFLRPHEGQATFSKIPRLRTPEGMTTESKEGQAEELLRTFFPLLPDDIEEDQLGPLRSPLPFTELGSQEIRTKIFEMGSWKAPGPDGLPAMVWKQERSVGKHCVSGIWHLVLTELSM
jgi:hypothetical protein